MDRLSSFGQIRAVTDDVIDAIASTESIAADGAVILASAWDLDRYRKNPVVLVAHRDTEMPVARAMDIKVVGRELRAKIRVDKDDPRGADVLRKVRQGFLSGLSVRWNPRKWEYRSLNGKKVLHFVDVELLEISFVSIPSDAGALILRGAQGEVLTQRALASAFPANGVAKVGALDSVRSNYERAWTRPEQPKIERDAEMRANLELAAITLGAKRMVNALPEEQGRWPSSVNDELRAAWQAHVLGDDAPKVVNGRNLRAMDTSETGFGAELVGTAYEASIWNSARTNDELIRRIESIRLKYGESAVTTSAGLPEVHFVGENNAYQTDGSNRYASSKWGTNSSTGSGSKFTLQSILSGELNGDTVIDFVPSLRRTLADSWRLYLGSCIYNGDTTNAATGNINSDDADPADTKHFLAWDGIRHHYLVDATGQGENAAAAIAVGHIDTARRKLTTITDSINSLSHSDWGNDPRDLLILADVRTAREIRGLNRYDRQTGLYDGIRIASPTYATRSEADGKLSATATNNTKGQLSIVNLRGWRLHQYNGITTEAMRIQGTDQVQLEFYARMSLHKHGDLVAAGCYNLTV